MTELTESEQLAHFQARMAANSAAALPSIGEIVAFLVQSEDQMLVLMQYIQDPQQAPVVPAQGDVEFGFVLYWIHNPPPQVVAVLALHPLLRAAYDVLAFIAPPTQITTAQYNQLIADLGDYGLPWDDGTIYGAKYKYQQLDPCWMLAALNYAVNVLDPSLITPFPNNVPAAVTLCRKDGNPSLDPVIGIVGDWGTGYFPDENPNVNCPAQRVMEQITNPQFSPPIDYLIHLGDVYYAGTDLRPLPGEEPDNFYSLWPDQGPGRNWTLNSNHEMYGAASGYFDVALQPGGHFDGQNGMSYFSMTYGPWLILGLDSGYYSDAANGLRFYMEGGIAGPVAQQEQQIGWMARFRDHQGPIMVMTHHTGCDLDGSQITSLFTQVTNALGRQPNVWYWGHVHNAIVYDNIFDSKTQTRFVTMGRCCGHGAIPFGNAWGIENSGNILYYAHTPDPDLPDTGGSDPANPRVRNGYALVTLHTDGGFTEQFYETGVSTPVWQQTWSAADLGGN